MSCNGLHRLNNGHEAPKTAVQCAGASTLMLCAVVWGPWDSVQGARLCVGQGSGLKTCGRRWGKITIKTQRKPTSSMSCFWKASRASAPVQASTASNPPLSIALRKIALLTCRIVELRKDRTWTGMRARKHGTKTSECFLDASYCGEFPRIIAAEGTKKERGTSYVLIISYKHSELLPSPTEHMKSSFSKVTYRGDRIKTHRT